MKDEQLDKARAYALESGIQAYKSFNKRILCLLELIRKTPNVHVALFQIPQVNLAIHQAPWVVTLYVAYDLDKPVPVVPDHVQKYFLKIINKCARFYTLISCQIGFRSHMNLGGLDLTPIHLPLNCNHDEPMLKLVLST